MLVDYVFPFYNPDLNVFLEFARTNVLCTWFDTGLCFSPGLLRISSSCRLLKLDTPSDFTSPASLQASKALNTRKAGSRKLDFELWTECQFYKWTAQSTSKCKAPDLQRVNYLPFSTCNIDSKVWDWRRIMQLWMKGFVDFSGEKRGKLIFIINYLLIASVAQSRHAGQQVSPPT